MRSKAAHRALRMADLLPPPALMLPLVRSRDESGVRGVGAGRPERDLVLSRSPAPGANLIPKIATLARRSFVSLAHLEQIDAVRHALAILCSAGRPRACGLLLLVDQ